MKEISTYFETYPSSNECFVTSDGFIFHTAHDAATHASALEDKQVVHTERGVLSEQQDVAEQQEVIDGTVAAGETSEAEADAKPKKNKK
jgi:hypothetical protein